ncbi:TIGR01777 family protein [Thermosulfurimonas marina]|uniref:TIGR01777 family protein n=2 Tax=Thermosulfurimonas marina TaxID=2047767 RepID=A0A6H1WUY8_9BACT|nr:TIGR01777 family protein [Thermosulfurimonas marina]
MKRVFVAGGTGFIGGHLLRALVEKGLEVRALVRSRAKVARLPQGVRAVLGDPLRPGPWQEEAATCEVAFNLTGANIFRRWDEEYKRLIRDSRVLSSRLLAETLPPGGTLVNASAVGYYGDTGEEEVDEDHPPGEDFLARVCREWEEAAFSGELRGLRVVVGRFGVVLGPDGGALLKMLPAFRLGFGGPIGDGRQWFPWIHVRDLVEALLFLAERPEARGPFNLVAPEVVRQRDFARTLGRVLRRPAFLPTPRWALRLLFGEVAQVLTASCRARPRRLLDLGFRFRFPRLFEALEDLLRR